MRAIPKSSDREMGNEIVTVYRKDQEEVVKKSSYRKVKIILIIIIFFLLACLVGAVSFIISLKKENSKGDEVVSSKKNQTSSSIPTDNIVLDIPQNTNCNILHCKECSDESCNICEDFTRPIYENGIIKKCLCQIGEGPKCLTVDTEKNECSSCNIGYKLENGKCLVDYHFKITFKSIIKQETIKIAGLFFPYIEKMIVNNEVLEEPIKEYILNAKNEELDVYYKFDLENRESLTGFFEGLDRMISISFTTLFNTEKITKMDRMFYGCKKLKSLDLSSFNTNNVVSMKKMFYCPELTSIDLSSFNPEQLTDMSYMFYNCYKLTSLDLSNFRTPKLENLEHTFENCLSLTSLDLSSLITQNVININSMISNCESLRAINFRNFYTTNVQEMSSLFYGCSSLTSIDLSNFDTLKVKSISSCFEGCSSLSSIDMSSFMLPKINKFDKVFKDCKNLKYINMKLLNINEAYFEQTFYNISSSGKIVVNNEMKSFISNILSGWEILTN